MILHRAKVGGAVAIMGMALLLATSAPASASQLKSSKHHKTTSHTTLPASSKGSNPNGSFCNEGKALKAAAEKNFTAEEKDIEAGNWPAVKKIILADFTAENKLIPQISQYLNSVPANVKAAEEVELKALPAEEKAIEGMTSMAQFNSTVQTLGQSPAELAAEKVTAAYQTAQCGTP